MACTPLMTPPQTIQYICLHMVKWFQVLLFNISNSIYWAFLSNTNNLQKYVWFLRTNNNNPFEGNYTRMLWAILNKSWRQHPTKQQLYGHLPPIRKTIKVRWTRHAGHCWRSREKLISDVLLWTPSHGWAKAGQSAQTYIQQLYEDMGCSPEDLPEAMNDREDWQERVRDICAGSTTRWDDVNIWKLLFDPYMEP